MKIENTIVITVSIILFIVLISAIVYVVVYYFFIDKTSFFYGKINFTGTGNNFSKNKDGTEHPAGLINPLSNTKVADYKLGDEFNYYNGPDSSSYYTRINKDESIDKSALLIYPQKMISGSSDSNSDRNMLVTTDSFVILDYSGNLIVTTIPSSRTENPRVTRIYNQNVNQNVSNRNRPYTLDLFEFESNKFKVRISSADSEYTVMSKEFIEITNSNFELYLFFDNNQQQLTMRSDEPSTVVITKFI